MSNRIISIIGNGSDGWDLFNRARSMIRDGIEVIELTIGEHDGGTDPDILQAMYHAALGGHTGYAAVPGTPALRAHIAARMERHTGVPTTPDNILVTSGGQAALFSAVMAACDPGERAVFIDPYYATYPGTVRSAGAVPVVVQARPEDDFQPQAARMMAAAEGARALLVNTPNNPTGAVYTRRTLEGIAEVCRKQDLWLISDEVYDTQVWQGAHLSPRALPGMAERTIVIHPLSKSHAMTGSRIGWLCAPEAVVDKLIDLAVNITYGTAGFIQDAALFALQQGPDFEARVGAPFARRRMITQEVLAGQDVVRAAPISGAMYAMLDIRATGLSGDDFANALLTEERIAVMPGESFGRAAAGHVRVAMTIDDDLYRAALTRIVAFAARLAT